MQNPNFKLNLTEEKGNFAEIHITPLEKGFGHTLGNALRRVLLGNLEGSAATHVKIDGVRHQFSTLSGLQENIIDFILNLKGVYFKTEGDGPFTVKIDSKEKTTLTAGDLVCPAGVSVTNPEHVLAHISGPKMALKGQITVAKGIGYSPADEHNTDEIGLIPVDSIFTPVIKANYLVESTRVGRRTDLDMVRLMVETNGTITPLEAVKNAAEILSAYFTQIFDPTFTEEETVKTSLVTGDDQSIEELGLPTRVTNALKKGGFVKLNDFSSASYDDLLKVKNIGEKSVKDIIKKLEKKGIQVTK